jgi:hypothetical protein
MNNLIEGKTYSYETEIIVHKRTDSRQIGIGIISITFNRRRNIMRYLLVLIAAVLLSSAVDAQVRINLGINIGSQPIWGPTGNDHVENYYLPDIETYYNVPQHKYYYQEKGRWISSSSLPSRYRNFDLYNAHKVVLNERTPWRNHATNRVKYASFKGQHDQQPIRDARDPKYYVNPKHPEHNNWVKQQKQNKGNGKGNGDK